MVARWIVQVRDKMPRYLISEGWIDQTFGRIIGRCDPAQSIVLLLESMGTSGKWMMSQSDLALASDAVSAEPIRAERDATG